jgi:MFS family permease
MRTEALRQRAAMTATFVAHGLLFASWSAHIPQFKAQLGLSDASMGLVLLATPVGSVAAMALTGRLLSRVGSARVVRTALLGYCLAGPLVGLTGTPVLLFVTLLAWGAFQGSLDVSMNTQAIAVQRAQRRALMPGFHGAWSLGAFAGAGLGALGVAIAIGLTLQLLVLVVPVLVATAVLGTSMIDDRRRGPERPPPSGARPALSGALLLLAVTAFASMFCEAAAADWSAIYLRGTLHMSPGLAGLGFAVFSLLMVTVRLTGGRLLSHFGERRLLPRLALLAAAGFGLGLLVRSPAVALLGFGCLGAGMALVVPSAFTAAGELPGMTPGAGVAAVSACGWAGFVCAPPLIGQLAGVAGLGTALATVPVLAALIALTTSCQR